MLLGEDERNGENLKAGNTAIGDYWEEERVINRRLYDEVLRQQEQVSESIKPTGVEILHPGQAPVAKPTIIRAEKPLVEKTTMTVGVPFRSEAPLARKRDLIDRFFDWINSIIT